jgi:cbb3-type cytochrome oxidase subunit 1
MDAFVKAFIKASVAWLALGVSLGVAMALHPAWILYRPAHLHMLTLGFVAMMIFGVGYHVIPRIAGYPLVNARLPYWHWWLANVGLALMAAGFIVRVHTSAIGAISLGVGATLSALGAYTFAYLIWRTMDGPDALRRIGQRMHNGRRDLTVLQLVPKSPDAPASPAAAPRGQQRHARPRRMPRPWSIRDAR